MLENSLDQNNNVKKSSLYNRLKDKVNNTLLDDRILIAYSGMYSAFSGARTMQLYQDDQSIIGGLFFTAAFAGIGIYTGIKAATKYNSYKKMNEDITKSDQANL